MAKHFAQRYQIESEQACPLYFLDKQICFESIMLIGCAPPIFLTQTRFCVSREGCERTSAVQIHIYTMLIT